MGACLEAFKKIIVDEFKISKFGFDGIDRSMFYVPVWKCVPKLFRWILQGASAIYLFALMIVSLTATSIEHNSARWLVYLTSWSYMLCTTYFITAFIVNMKNASKFNSLTDSTMQLSKTGSNIKDYGATDVDLEESDQWESTSETHHVTTEEKFYWLLFSMTHAIGALVVIIYWGFLFTSFGDSTLKSYLAVDRHGIVYFLLFLEFIFTDIPVRFLHFVYPLCFVLVYLIFSVVYWAISDIIIYSVTDWGNKPGQAVIFIVVSLVGGIIMHAFIFLIDTGKHKLAALANF